MQKLWWPVICPESLPTTFATRIDALLGSAVIEHIVAISVCHAQRRWGVIAFVVTTAVLHMPPKSRRCTNSLTAWKCGGLRPQRSVLRLFGSICCSLETQRNRRMQSLSDLRRSINHYPYPVCSDLWGPDISDRRCPPLFTSSCWTSPHIRPVERERSSVARAAHVRRRHVNTALHLHPMLLSESAGLVTHQIEEQAVC